MRISSFRAKASIAILMAVTLVANANLAFADDRGDRRGGKFDKPGFTRHSDRGGRGHYSDRAQRNDGRRGGDSRRDNRRDSRRGNQHDHRFDGSSFFGGVVLGSILSANQGGANRHYAGNSRNTLHYGGYVNRRFDSRRRANFRYPSHISSFAPPFSPLLRSGYGRVSPSGRIVSGRATNTVVYQTVINPAPLITEAPIRLTEPTRRLLIDLEGNCFDVSRDSLGNEVRLQLDPAQCDL